MDSASEPSPRSPDFTPRSLSQFGPWLCLALLLVAGLIVLGPLVQATYRQTAAARAQWAYQLDNEEAAILYQAKLLRSGHWPYLAIQEGPPWVVGTYPPLYYILLLPVTDPVGAASTPDYGPARTLVALSVAAIAAFAILIPGTARADSRKKWLIFSTGWLAGLLFLSFMEVHRWIPYARVDFPALAFSMAGLWVYIRWGDRSTWGIWASAILFVLAGYTKQTALAAPLACMIHRTSTRGWKAGGVYLACYGGLGIAIFAVLTALTSGRFPVHTIVYNSNTMDLERLLVWIRHTMKFHPWILAASVLSAALIWLGSGTPKDQSPQAVAGEGPLDGIDRPVSTWTYPLRDPVLTWWGLSWVQVVTIAKAGTAENYLLEPLAATAVLVSCGLGFVLSDLRRGIRWAGTLGLAFLLFGHLGQLRGWWGGHNWSEIVYRPRIVSAVERSDFQRLLGEARRRGGTLFAEFGNYHLALGQPILYQPFIMSELARQGRWNPRPVLERIENQALSMIILERPVELAGGVLTEKMIQAIQTHYELWPQSPSVMHGSQTHVYVPRSGSR